MKRTILLLLPIVIASGCSTAPDAADVEADTPEIAIGTAEMQPEPPPPSVARYLVSAQEIWDDPTLAIDAYTRAIEIDPDLAYAHYSRAHLFKGFDRINEALEDYTRAIEIDPGFIQAYLRRGELRLWYLGDEAGAEDFRVAYEIDPDDREAALSYAGVVQWDNPIQAREIYDRLVEQYPGYADVHVARAKWRLERGDLSGSLSDFRVVVDQHDADGWLYSYVVLLELAQGEVNAAYRDVVALGELTRTDMDAALVAARFLAITSQASKAAEFYTIYMESEWVDPHVYLEAAMVAAAVGEGRTARRYLELYRRETDDQLGAEVALAAVFAMEDADADAASVLEGSLRENDWYLPAWIVAATVAGDTELGEQIRQEAGARLEHEGPFAFGRNVAYWIWTNIYLYRNPERRWAIPTLPQVPPIGE